MKIIAIEEHFLSPEVRAAWSALGAGRDGSGLHLGAIEGRLEDLGEERLRSMDETGVDVQVLSLTTPGLHDLDGQEGETLARRTNDLIAATVAAHPDRFQGFAALPTSSPEFASREFERAVRVLGLKGAMLHGRTRSRNLDHPDFRPILERAASLGMPVFIHPQIPQRAVREIYYSGFGEAVDLAFSTYGLGWHYEAGIQFLRLVLAGVFDQFPDLQIILGHWGEVILFFAERLEGLERTTRLRRSIRQCLHENLYVTASGMFSEAYLARSIECVGIDRILFSTDYPYQYRPGRTARRFLEDAPLNASEKEKFASSNWVRLSRPPSPRQP